MRGSFLLTNGSHPSVLSYIQFWKRCTDVMNTVDNNEIERGRANVSHAVERPEVKYIHLNMSPHDSNLGLLSASITFMLIFPSLFPRNAWFLISPYNYTCNFTIHPHVPLNYSHTGTADRNFQTPPVHNNLSDD
jgi:hypothetical protein